MITLENALEKTKEFIAKMKGLDIVLGGGRPLIDLLDFQIINKEENEKYYTLFVEFIASLYNSNRVTFRVKVNKETGTVDDIERIKQE